MQKPVLVIKLGSAIIANNKGVIKISVIKKLSAEAALLAKRYRIVLVSSGAVASGKKVFGNYKGTLTERKAAAAVGNPILIRLYDKYFSKHGINVAQALCERQHFSNRQQFLQLKETFAELWQHNIIPVVNENDIVSNVELKFSDNDELAVLIAAGFDASALIICTMAGGLINREQKILPVVKSIDESILNLVQKNKSATGIGGMLSKLTFTKLATLLGIDVAMCSLNGPRPLLNALNKKNGTFFPAKKAGLNARQKWLASGSVTIGSIIVDKGAAGALAKRKSLLTIGIKKIGGFFAAGEVVQVTDESNVITGVAKVKISSIEIKKALKQKNTIAAHADDIVIF